MLPSMSGLDDMDFPEFGPNLVLNMSETMTPPLCQPSNWSEKESFLVIIAFKYCKEKKKHTVASCIYNSLIMK